MVLKGGTAEDQKFKVTLSHRPGITGDLSQRDSLTQQGFKVGRVLPTLLPAKFPFIKGNKDSFSMTRWKTYKIYARCFLVFLPQEL